MKRGTLPWLVVGLLVAACGPADQNFVEKPTDTQGESDTPFWHGGDGQPLEGCAGDTDCDDDNPCTTDRCHFDKTCRFEPILDQPCDDGDSCTTDDHCSPEGECLGGPAKVCNDLDDCTVDSCDPATGCTYLPAADGADCDDGELCTTGDQCQDGSCVGTAPLCDDGNDCTADSCDPDSGECTHIEQSNLPCNDDNACTNGELCDAGVCTGGSEVACDDNNDCTVDSCLEIPAEEGGGCVHDPDVGKACDDLNPCSVEDACNDEGICLGVGGSCDDDNPCTTDLCSPVDGCLHEPANGGSCDDGDPCTGVGTCFGGECQPGVATDCDDGIDCTSDSCDDAGDCVHIEDDSLCDDELFCNGTEFCDDEFGCLGDGPPDEDDGIACTADSCLEEAGIIQHIPQHFLCDDNDPCTTDLCHVEEGCQNTPKVCDDSNPCTQDSCSPEDGECLNVPLGECCLVDSDCLVDNPCLGGVCDVQTNECSFHPLLCDDYDPCTTDSCEGGCQHQPIPGCTNECDKDLDCAAGAADLDLCTVPTCTVTEGQGICTYPPRACDDGLACTSDLCLPELGCFYPAIPWCQEPCATDADCASDDACDLVTCVDGLCANVPDLCDDGLACTGGECHPDTGECQLFECPVCTCPTCLINDDCDDANLCTHDLCLVAEEGTPGQCRHLPLSCDDGNPCTKDLCLAKQGCFYTPKSDCAGCQTDDQCTDDTLCTDDSCVNAQCQREWVCG